MKYKSVLIRGVPLSKAKNPCLNLFLTLPLHHQISIIKKSYLIQPKNEVILTFVV